ncbi:PREDICTED: uncharacterized protein LOC104745515 isoform X2 [Camelina sativa]|uniref:Uncharacterized protein LOC104745515 isoform X2 n=1 Tax=Camelina sativa TaxID=90675 RepID=A0ABM0W397_CAMSA|nr:PREDICTED: uncharacterized protein LOC104745515 isoform X2 [Camelina sativa]
MAGNGMPTLGRVKVCDLAPSEGLPSDSYKLAVTTLSQSLAQYSAAIIQFPTSDGALLRSGLDSARLYFHQRDSYPAANNNMIHTNDSSDWCKTSGYYADPQSWQESYEYRPGLSPTEPTNSMEFPPSGLPDIFALLGKAARVVLDAIGYYLNLRSCPFTEILDNVPLRNNEISSSVLSVCCYARPSFHGAQHHNLTEDEQLILYSDHDHQLDKSLISFVKSDKAGLHIRDMHGQWILVDMDLGPQEAVVYPGLALYQATAGYVSPAVHRTDLNSMQGSIEGRFSLAFKLMPKSMTNLSCSEMRAAGHGVEAQFQLPVSVDDFMQRPHSNDELFNRQTLQSFSVPQSQDGPSLWYRVNEADEKAEEERLQMQTTTTIKAAEIRSAESSQGTSSGDCRQKGNQAQILQPQGVREQPQCNEQPLCEYKKGDWVAAWSSICSSSRPPQ